MGKKLSEWSQPDKLKNNHCNGKEEEGSEEDGEEKGLEEEGPRIVFAQSTPAIPGCFLLP